MAKKKPEIIEKEKEIFLYGNKKDYENGKDNAFVPGCINNGISESAAREIWHKMEKFSLYAFNKSHSAAYAVISVRTAWLKYYHPGVFWTATLNSVTKKADRVRKYLYCAQKHGLTILPPSVNESELMFSYKDNSIRIGLLALRDLGKAALPILEERSKNGKFTSLENLIWRCHTGKKVLASLAYSGATDEFGLTRREIAESCEVVSEYLSTLHKYDSWSDFDEINDLYVKSVKLQIPHLEEYNKQEKLNKEYQFAGMYVSEHPLDEHLPVITAIDPDYIADLIVESSDENADEVVNYRAYDQKVTVIGIVKDIELKMTKNGDKMLVGTIEDKTGSIRFTVFAQTLAGSYFNKNLLVENNVVIMEGMRKINEFGAQINTSIVNTVEMVSSKLSKIYCLTDMENYERVIQTARECVHGNLTVILQIEFQNNIRGAVLIDEESDQLFTRKYRKIEDPRNLKIDISGYFSMKEVSKQIRVC